MTVAIPSVPECPDQLLYELKAMTSAEAKRQWRAAIKAAWNDCCAYCGTPPIDDDSLTIDHVKPKARGGEDRTTNCIPACRRCNHNKGSEEWLAWYRLQPYYNFTAEIRIRHWLETGQVLDYENPEDSLWLDAQLNSL
jgi:hypothetical protein